MIPPLTLAPQLRTPGYHKMWGATAPPYLGVPEGKCRTEDTKYRRPCAGGVPATRPLLELPNYPTPGYHKIWGAMPPPYLMPNSPHTPHSAEYKCQCPRARCPLSTSPYVQECAAGFSLPTTPCNVAMHQSYCLLP